MRKWLWTISAVSLLMIPFAAEAADYGSSPPVTGTAPPVAQTLVREGDFAIKLAAELDLGTPTDESVAEDMLVKAGVAPVNGWLSDYPMTPQIIGQLQESISRAASQGALPMTSDQAVRGLYTITAQFNLPTPTGQTAQNTPPPYPSDQQALENYYSEAGPPIMTYYPPPPDYVYLYDWVPYPVWWFGFWFPGFYICQNFSTVVVFQSRTVVVSNHFIDRDTRTVVTVDPVGHHGRNGGRPETALRTEQGDRFRTFADMHHGIRMAGPSGDRRHGEGDRAGTGAGRYGSAEARRGAASIYSRSTSRASMVPGNGAFRSESGPGNREVRQNNRGPSAVPGSMQRTGRDQNWPLPSEERSISPRMRESGSMWGRRYPEPDRSFRSPLTTSPDLSRSAFRSFNGMGGEGYGNGNNRARPSSDGHWQGRQDMNDAFSGNGGRSGSFCRGKC
jgi:hypothetical protein